MIAVNRLDHVGVRVHEFARTVAFYQQFGFGVIRDDRQEHVVVLRNAAGTEINLLDSADAPMTDNILMDQAPRYPGYTHIALQVADIDVTLRDLEAAGITVTEGPVTFGDGKTSIFFRDPDRNVIELTQLPADLGSRYDGEAGR
ncbi:MAG: VOC family protein [Gammaproteobacteria bacterium]|nr:VOC family protein [Gammaproteobacteria bacterium]